MTNPPPTPKRFRPRFSVRTLAIFGTLVCVYAACWGPTKRRGVDDVIDWIYRDFHFNIDDRIEGDPRFLVNLNRASSPAPFLVGIKGPAAYGVPLRQQYYFWFFGYVAKLPWEKEVELPIAAQLPLPDSSSDHLKAAAAIDFDDCCDGYYLSDIAATLDFLEFRGDYRDLREAFLRGYCEVKPPATEHTAHVNVFLAARWVMICLFVARKGDDGKRLSRMLDVVLAKLRTFLREPSSLG